MSSATNARRERGRRGKETEAGERCSRRRGGKGEGGGGGTLRGGGRHRRGRRHVSWREVSRVEEDEWRDWGWVKWREECEEAVL